MCGQRSHCSPIPINKQGSALHESVTPFFYLSLGATTSQIGRIQSIILASGLSAYPLLGYFIDRHGAALPLVVASGFCAVGCFVRGASRNVGELYLAATVLGLGGGVLDM